VKPEKVLVKGLGSLSKKERQQLVGDGLELLVQASSRICLCSDYVNSRIYVAKKITD